MRREHLGEFVEALGPACVHASDRERHLLVSMHPSEIPMAPSQILLVSKGKIWSVPPATSWPEIRALLQRPKLTPV